MSKELEIRSQTDTETVRGLLLINGGGAVALLVFLPHVLGVDDYAALARAIVWALLFFQCGLLFAVIHNHLRRRCSIAYQSHNYRPPSCTLFGRSLGTPCVCAASLTFMVASAVAFVVAGLIVFFGGLQVLK